MNPLNIRIKRIMDDIIDVAYADVDAGLRRRFHSFLLDIQNKEVKSTSGMYHERDHRIEVYNPRLGVRHMAKCSIHELSHHIDTCLNGHSGHKAPFYEAYAKLAYASIDMGILTKDDFYHDTWSSDQNKVRDIMDKYTAHPVEYTIPESKIVCVKNCYAQKESLKSAGYRWNSVESIWEKAVDDVEAEFEFLKGLGCSDFYEQDEFDMHVNAVTYICATGKTFACKDALRSYGFWYDGDGGKMWKKKILAAEAEAFLEELRKQRSFAEVEFAYVKQTKSKPKGRQQAKSPVKRRALPI